MTGKREGKREGPSQSCVDCAYEQSQSYFRWGKEEGYDVYCIHPANSPRRYIGNTWETPSWCPFLKDKQQ